jgi:transposase
MMGHQPPPQPSLFYTGFHLDQRVRKDHPLRKINDVIDFEFIYQEVRDKYGSNGNVSVAPPVILKLMLLLVLYNIRSERELMETLPERLDWLWFMGYDLDSKVPNHSVLSKARKKWGMAAFKSFFDGVVWQCVEAGLVDGKKIFVDSSLIDADASNNSVVDTHSLKRYLNKSYRELEKRLADKDEIPKESQGDSQGVNARYVSTTDPDASIVKRGKPKLRYQTHRAVDPGYEVITATEMTPGEVNEAHRLTSLMDSHQENTGRKAETVVADSKYGTIDNYLACYDRGVKAHIPDLDRNRKNKGRRKAIFSEDRFSYDQKTDTYRCPAGKILKRRSLHKHRQSIDYSATRKECKRCELRPQCTSNKSGRTIKRHLRQTELDQMRSLTKTSASRRDIRTRTHLMERTFANAKRYEFDRARWRGLWRVSIQEYLTATIQNIQKLITHGKYPGRRSAIEVSMGKRGWNISYLSNQFMHFRYWQTPNLERE